MGKRVLNGDGAASSLPPPPTVEPASSPSPFPGPAQAVETEEPVQSETQAASEAPVQSEELPAARETQESQGAAQPALPEPLPGWGLAAVGLAAGLAIAGAAALIARAVRGGRRAAPSHPPEGGRAPIPFEVEKLHEQGARKSQQDSFFVSPAGGRMLAVVADGMGGLTDGDKVSQTAVTAMANGFYNAQGSPEQVLLSLLEQANRAVNVLLGSDGLRHSGSTVVAGLIENNAFHYLSVGDSRICLFRDGALYQLNREHVYRNELYTDAVNGLCAFQEAEQHPKGGGLTSYLGMGELKYVDIPAQAVAVREGDVFILMSDGVYNALTEYELTAALSAPGSAADALQAAIQAKGYANQDNYTAVVMRRRDDEGNLRDSRQV